MPTIELSDRDGLVARGVYENFDYRVHTPQLSYPLHQSPELPPGEMLVAEVVHAEGAVHYRPIEPIPLGVLVIVGLALIADAAQREERRTSRVD